MAFTFSKTLNKKRALNFFWLFSAALFLPILSIATQINSTSTSYLPLSTETEKDVLDIKKLLNNKVFQSKKFNFKISNPIPQDSTKKTGKDTSIKDLTYPIKQNTGREKSDYQNNIDLNDPSVKTYIEYNTKTGEYEEYKEIAGRKTLLRSMSKSEYMAESAKEDRKKYFEQRTKSNAGSSGYNNNKARPPLIKTPPVLDKVFRGGLIDIRPSGSAELTFGGNFNTVRNPAFSARQQRTGQFDFDQKIQINVTGKIGNALDLGIKYDTDATFDFDNQTKLNWVGKEDQMLKKIELGNVSLPLNGSLIQGGQSLFGIKTDWQFGKLKASFIATQNKGQRTETTVNGGAQVTNYNIQASSYDQNRHFFLGQAMKNQYDNALSQLPIINSGVFINRVEVWVTNRSGSVDNTRDILALMDLGEQQPNNVNLIPESRVYTDNTSNNLYTLLKNNAQVRSSSSTLDAINGVASYLRIGLDYELLTNARQLNTNEFTVNERLGYISLNSALNNDEILGVAFEYTFNGITYKVGEFASEQSSSRTDSKVLMVKMLKGNIIRTRIPMWELMMKNIYSLGSFNINPADLNFNVIYNDDPSGADLNYLPVNNIPGLSDGVPLIRVMNLDKINRQQEAKHDGMIDILEGFTIQSQQGRIIFPVREPFGNYLRAKFNGDQRADKYVYDALYDSTRWLAEQDVAHNKFFLKGSYKGSSSSEISLNALNVPQGSVVVTANGTKLTENVDYIVDYNAGKVTIINQGILQSGATIKVSAESNSVFNIQQRTLLGARFDYIANKKLLLGGTIMHMYERPLTPKTNIGDEPLLNTVIGVDASYNSSSRFLTKLVDKLPFIETKAESKLTAQGEYARIFPGKARGQNKTRGVSYIDDFEGAETTFDLRMVASWKLASLPQYQPLLFPEWNSPNKKDWGNYRAKTAWYNIDPTFYRTDKFTPANVQNNIDMQSNHYMREVLVTEVFPNKQIQQGAPTILPTLDLAFFPKERGIYNYNNNIVDFNADGTFKQPTKAWGGIMRRIESNDFEAANIDYIEVWMMDPFTYNTTGSNKGQLYIDLGNVSEDILPDRRKVFENGLNAKGDLRDVDTSIFGRVPLLPQINNAFDNEPSARPFQDLGLDGLNDDDEKAYFVKYLDSLKTLFGENSKIYQMALADPSNDNYFHNRDGIYDGGNDNSIISRYKKFNSLQGNSTLNKLGDGTPQAATNLPDNEDINNDFTMNQTEDYFQYKIDLSPQDLEIGKGFVTDINEINKELKNGKTEKIKWIQLKIPVKQFTNTVGNISDFKSIRFMRMFMKGFTDSTILRFGQLQLVRADWRRYLQSLNTPGAVVPLDPTDATTFVVSTVNIEENGKRSPIRYIEPPGIDRVQDPTSQNVVQQNEQSLSLRVCNLKAGDSRAAYKTTNFDVRNYKNFKMFVHAEGTDVKDGELSAFIRVGTDLISNYYEYEIPLKITPDGAYAADRIWMAENEFDFPLSDLFGAKDKRTEAGNPLTRPFFYVNGKGHKISLLGLPDLSNLRVVMLGIRNNADVSKCGEVWFNEMRVTDITNKGGWATTGRVVAQMADFATLSASGNISTIGYGGVDQRLNERNLSDNYQYDLSSSFELGKFFPQKASVNIPMFIGYSGTIMRPKFDPLNPDVELDRVVERMSPTEKKAKLRSSEDVTSRYSLNFTNVRKAKTSKGPSMPWNISNFNFTYSYIHLQRRNIQIEQNFSKTYHGSVGYTYSPKIKPWEPFKFIKSKRLAILRDFNLYALPQNITIRFDADRYYSETQNRSNDAFKQFTPRLFDKNFTFNRVYIVNFPLTKGGRLKLDYNASANARVQEPFGQLNTQEKRDSVRDDFFRLGRMTNFTQTANFNYELPFDKVGALNWINTTVKYGSNYGWTQAPPAAASLGNTIQNSRDIQVNSTFNMNTLYNKIPFLKRIEQGGKKAKNNKEKTKPATPKPGDKQDDSEKPPAKKKEKQMVGTNFFRALMMVKNVAISYNQKEGTVLPGFIHSPDYFGQNFAQDAPGLPFILGSQKSNTRYELAKQGALTNDSRMNNFFMQNKMTSITGTARIEPFKGFVIQLNANLNRSNNLQSQFRFDADSSKDWRDFAITETGNFTMSHIFIRTAFNPSKASNGWDNQTYNNFEGYRFVVAQRQQAEDVRIGNRTVDPATFYPKGYGKTAQDVMIPSFLAAYTGSNQGKIGLSAFPKVPLPNWNINYNGLTKIKSIAKTFTNITIQHRYTGLYTVGGYTSNLAYNSKSATADTGSNFVSRYNINNVSMRESFAPLIGIDFTTKGGLTGGFKVNRSRQVSLFVQNANITEMSQNELSFRLGYRTNGMKLPIKVNGKRLPLDNDLQMDLDVSVQNTVNLVRNIDKGPAVVQGGQRVVLVRPNINYMINTNVNLQIFYDRRASKPFASNSFPTALTTFGFKLRYTIQ